jgi:Sec-independent protein translocase protein TatA
MLAEILGPDLLVVVIVLVVLLFGGAAIPKFAKSLGSVKSEFENGLKASKSAKADIDDVITRVKTSEPTN